MLGDRMPVGQVDLRPRSVPLSVAARSGTGTKIGEDGDRDQQHKHGGQQSPEPASPEPDDVDAASSIDFGEHSDVIRNPDRAKNRSTPRNPPCNLPGGRTTLREQPVRATVERGNVGTRLCTVCNRLRWRSSSRQCHL